VTTTIECARCREPSDAPPELLRHGRCVCGGELVTKKKKGRLSRLEKKVARLEQNAERIERGGKKSARVAEKKAKKDTARLADKKAARREKKKAALLAKKKTARIERGPRPARRARDERRDERDDRDDRSSARQGRGRFAPPPQGASTQQTILVIVLGLCCLAGLIALAMYSGGAGTAAPEEAPGLTREQIEERARAEQRQMLEDMRLKTEARERAEAIKVEANPDALAPRDPGPDADPDPR
jgi:hypothetical protein